MLALIVSSKKGGGTMRARRAALVLAAAAILAAVSAVGPAAGTAAVTARRTGEAGRVDQILAHMTLAQKIGQMFMFSFDGTTADPEVMRMVRDWGVGGLILYTPNVTSGPQLRALTAALQRAARVPLLISTDEEGGAVAMVPFSAGVPALLSPRDYGSLGSADRVYRDTRAAGRALRALGVNMDLAPVVDVLLDPRSPIGARSYGADPALVARLGAAAIRGYQDAGVAATAKHFLGLGGVSLDAHLGLPTVRRTMAQLESVELAPMRAAIGAGVDALMVTHVVIPALDPSGAPASLSRRIITGFIRGTLGYQGLIISDSLMMGAIDTRLGMGEAAVEAAAAGSDIVLISYYQSLAPAVMRGAMDALLHAVATHRISPAQIDAAARRVLLLKAKVGLLS
jgi:beta-N-acetylhexosaminidase